MSQEGSHSDFLERINEDIVKRWNDFKIFLHHM